MTHAESFATWFRWTLSEHTLPHAPQTQQAANYLNIKGLLDLTCQTVANMIKGEHAATRCCRSSDGCLRARVWWRRVTPAFGRAGHAWAAAAPWSPCNALHALLAGKTPEEIRKTFNIKNDFTPEEEEEVRRENQVSCGRVLAGGGWVACGCAPAAGVLGMHIVPPAVMCLQLSLWMLRMCLSSATPCTRSGLPPPQWAFD